MEKETTQLSGYPLLKNPRGVFIGTRGKGARGQTLAQSTGAAAPVLSRKRGYGRVSAAIGWPRAAL